MNPAEMRRACQHERVQTRYLILAALLTGVAILVAAAVWLARF